MVIPGNVQLSHSGDRTWLTDQIVLLDVTGFSVVTGLEDGWYRIVVGGQNPGLTLRSDASKHLLIDVGVYLRAARKAYYHPVQPTEWSLTTSEAKAFLLYVTIETAAGYRERFPVAMNQDVWKAFLLAYPGAGLGHSGYGRPFKVSTPENPELAYIESIEIPKERHNEAIVLVEVYIQGGVSDGAESSEPDTDAGRIHGEDG